MSNHARSSPAFLHHAMRRVPALALLVAVARKGVIDV
jgi:hypothetical protein